MLFMIVIIMLFIFVIVMLFMIVIVMLFIVMIIVIIMRVVIERTAFTEIQCGQPVTFHQGDRHGFRCDPVNRLFQKRLKIMAHPENKVGLLKLFGL